ncbi:MAG: biopolymer transporter ExbD [Lentisphaeria bacterium]|nr:biopolymer transporter ExbD [Lentisphaeria bacterium]
MSSMNFERKLLQRRRYRSRLKYFSQWPELTALLDVLFLALLFFALTSSFIRIPGIGVELPRIAALEVAELERFVVSVTAPAKPGMSCRFYFKDKPVTFEELKHEFFRIPENLERRSIIICADRRVPFDTVTQVMAAAEAAKLPSFIAVMPPVKRSEVIIEKQ